MTGSPVTAILMSRFLPGANVPQAARPANGFWWAKTLKEDNLPPFNGTRALFAGRQAVAAALPQWSRRFGAGGDPGHLSPTLTALAAELGLTEPRWVPMAGPDEAPAPFPGDLVLVATAPTSQYDALRRAVAQAPDLARPVACLALTGPEFHGQHGRPWHALPGNLHLCVAYPCDLSAAAWGPVLPALPAVAVCEAVTGLIASSGSLAGGRAGIKWVNDVLLDDAKVAGTLTAVRSVAGRITAVMVGLGLNVRQSPDLTGDPLAAPATSLANAWSVRGSAPDLDAALTAVLAALGQRVAALVDGTPAELMADYRARSVVVGREVQVWPPDGGGTAPRFHGRVRAITDALALKIAGVSAPVDEGRLVLVGPARPAPGTDPSLPA